MSPSWRPPDTTDRAPTLLTTRRNPPSAPLLETPLTPPASPKEGAVQLRADDWNQLPPESTYFLSVNRNKRSVGVNLKSPGGLKVVQDLIAKADVLIEVSLDDTKLVRRAADGHVLV